MLGIQQHLLLPAQGGQLIDQRLDAQIGRLDQLGALQLNLRLGPFAIRLEGRSQLNAAVQGMLARLQQTAAQGRALGELLHAVSQVHQRLLIVTGQRGVLRRLADLLLSAARQQPAGQQRHCGLANAPPTPPICASHHRESTGFAGRGTGMTA